MLISVHYPKAGGTTINDLLVDNFGDCLLREYSLDPLSVIDEYGVKICDYSPNEIGYNIKAIHGHFHPERFSHVENTRYITFLRHPLDILISLYFFWKGSEFNAHPIYHRFKQENPDIFSFAAYPAINTLMSETYFGGFDTTRFEFVGFHENRQNDLARLAELLDAQFDMDLHSNNTSDLLDEDLMHERHDITESLETRQKITDILAKDVKFFEKMKHDFG